MCTFNIKCAYLTEDEGGPLEAGFQEQASSHLKLHR